MLDVRWDGKEVRVEWGLGVSFMTVRSEHGLECTSLILGGRRSRRDVVMVVDSVEGDSKLESSVWISCAKVASGVVVESAILPTTSSVSARGVRSGSMSGWSFKVPYR